MNINNNPPLQTTIAWAIITMLAIFGIFTPEIFGIKGFDGGFAISFVRETIKKRIGHSDFGDSTVDGHSVFPGR